jgi:hypothetical protein
MHKHCLNKKLVYQHKLLLTAKEAMANKIYILKNSSENIICTYNILYMKNLYDIFGEASTQCSTAS